MITTRRRTAPAALLLGAALALGACAGQTPAGQTTPSPETSASSTAPATALLRRAALTELVVALERRRVLPARMDGNEGHRNPPQDGDPRNPIPRRCPCPRPHHDGLLKQSVPALDAPHSPDGDESPRRR